ncbi:leucine-rich repeat-containing protein 34 isoform X1 [Oncorhynchus kisutch]|uniref:Leucine rich repeat containing 34 n=1 Tax=Oncorhynchus kisutch TaxID=8019 RepID=A0A8C7LBG5_ONCKI|nr:leucine-rich repeat-containing protein 34 isoform X1 [Oncorhynchus kisutch]
MGSITDVYSSVCKELKLRTNRYILEVLQETEGKTGGITLKLTGNDRLRKVKQVTNKDALALSRTLRDNDSVTGLDLRYNCITDEGAGHLADLLKENVCLRFLDLTCNDIQTDGAEYIAKSLTSNDALLSLRLTGNKIGNGGAMHFASMLQVNSTLQELDVADSDLGTQSVIAFAIVLNNNKSLRSVNISRPLLFSHQEETAVHLSGMLVVNQCLRELHLGKMGMTDYGVERLTDALRTNYTLKYLDLRCNRVTRDGARCLAKVLKNNGTLEILDLASNRIEDDGALYLSQAIALPTCNLKALSIPNNNIATVGLVSLSRAMQANNTLTHIYIWGNRLEEPVCQAFSDLLSSGRLSSEQTDVCVYEVDGCVCLAEVFHGLKRHYYWTPSYGQDVNPASNAAVALTNTQLYPNSSHTP